MNGIASCSMDVTCHFYPFDTAHLSRQTRHRICCNLLAMKFCSAVLLLFAIFTPAAQGQSTLAMRSAESTRFIAAHGRYAWAGGYGGQGLEVWAGALQIVADVHPEFRRDGDVTAIPGALLAS